MPTLERPHTFFGGRKRNENVGIQPLDATVERLSIRIRRTPSNAIGTAACELDRALLNVPSARNVHADDGKRTCSEEGDERVERRPHGWMEGEAKDRVEDYVIAIAEILGRCGGKCWNGEIGALFVQALVFGMRSGRQSRRIVFPWEKATNLIDLFRARLEGRQCLVVEYGRHINHLGHVERWLVPKHALNDHVCESQDRKRRQLE
jgi:hypothetical protein